MTSKISFWKILLGLSCTGTIFSTIQTAALSLSKSEIIEIAEQVSVKIWMADFESSELGGSGVLVNKEGNQYTVLTNCHVLEEPTTYVLELPDDEEHRFETTQFQELCHDSADMAMVTFSSEHLYQVANLLIEQPRLSELTPIFVSGFPELNGYSKTRSLTVDGDGNQGVIRIDQGAKEGYELVHKIDTIRGMSGGAIFNQNGDLIGINAFQFSLEQKNIIEFWGVPVKYYLSWLNKPVLNQTVIDNSTTNDSTTNNFAPQPEREAEKFFLVGRAAFQRGDYPLALSSFDQGLEITPNNHVIWNDRGRSLGRLGQYEEAIASYDKALEIEPDYDTAWNNRGFSLEKLGKYEEAIASYDRAIDINPNYDIALNNRGWSLEKLERYEEAIASYDQAIDINPNFHNAWNNRGFSLEKLERYEEAITSYDRAIEIKPNYDIAWKNRGVSLDELERYEEAIESYDRAIEIKPNYDIAWNNRGVSLEKLGQYQEAIQSYERTIEINPQNQVARENLRRLKSPLKQ